jgi:hypothetical protein
MKKLDGCLGSLSVNRSRKLAQTWDLVIIGEANLAIQTSGKRVNESTLNDY